MSYTMDGKYTMIKVPGLMVMGAEDAATPAELVNPIVQEMLSCKLKVLKGVHHFSPTGAVAEVNRFIQQFVEDLSH